MVPVHALASASSAGNGAVIAYSILFGIVYLLPSIIALCRWVQQKPTILLVNILLGWTVFGWIITLAMACRARPEAPAVLHPGYLPPGSPRP